LHRNSERLEFSMNYLLAAGLLALPGIAHAAGFQDLAVVERAVVIAAGADIGEPGGPLAPVDRRLKLAACPKVAADPPAMNAITVRCPALGWRLRVPLARSEATSVAAAPSSSAAPVVRRGDVVELQAGSGSFTCQHPGGRAAGWRPRRPDPRENRGQGHHDLCRSRRKWPRAARRI
jgi:flagella basal body P-ring formation protein FlgA